MFVVKGSSTFSVPGSGTDPLGSAYGTVHQAGSSTKTSWPRDTNGIWSVKTSIVEMLKKFRNLLNILAPATAAAAKNPTLELEDGTQLEGDTGGSGDDNMPYVLVFYFGKPVGGEKPLLAFIGQASRAGGGDSDPNKYSEMPIEFSAVDGLGFTPAPDATTYTEFTGFTFVPLSGNDKYGAWIAG